MKHFFREHPPIQRPKTNTSLKINKNNEEQIQCEDALLEAFIK